MVRGDLLACLPRKIFTTKNILSLFQNLFLLECFGDDALDRLNLLLVSHALRFGVARGPLKDSLAPIHDAKDAGVGFALEGGRCPVSAELDRASESVFSFVTPRVQWREIQLFAWLIHMCATEVTISTQVAHGFSLLVDVVESCGVALIIRVSEVKSAVNQYLSAFWAPLRKQRKLAFFIEREVLK